MFLLTPSLTGGCGKGHFVILLFSYSALITYFENVGNISLVINTSIKCRVPQLIDASAFIFKKISAEKRFDIIKIIPHKLIHPLSPLGGGGANPPPPQPHVLIQNLLNAEGVKKYFLSVSVISVHSLQNWDFCNSH